MPDGFRGRWLRFLHGPRAVWLTHGSLLGMTVGFFGLLLATPWWVSFVPGVLLAHRIGVMLHEYIHGIPFRRYRDCLAILTLYDGLLLLFGLLELFRGTHLSHHRWLNREGDSGYRHARERRFGNRWWNWLAELEATQHLGFFREAFQGRHPFVRVRRILVAMAWSAAMVGVWMAWGRPDVVGKLILISLFTTAVPVSLRGAIEHHGPPGSPGFANDYRTLIPLFNLNRHIHHHEEPRRPWYLLEFRQDPPLRRRDYFTHWFRVYGSGDFALLRPMPKSPAARGQPAPGDPAGMTHS